LALDRHQIDVILVQMEIHVDAIRRDLVATASALGDESLVESLRRLVDASEPALRLRLIDVLSEAALSLNGQLVQGHVEVRLAGRDPELVYVDEPEAPEEPPAPGDDLSARITLRLPEALKTSLDAASAREGVSANAWIVRALARALEPRSARRSSNRLQGFARS
jgi:predicted HicB family RNase H-like nuclease